MKWKEDEEKVLTDNPSMSIKDLMVLLPHRSYNSIKHKRVSLRLPVLPVGGKKKKQSKVKSLKEAILIILQSSEVPLESRLFLKESKKYFPGTTMSDIAHEIGILQNEGYDIKKITGKNISSYVLIRFGTFRADEMYRVLGKVETPFIMSSDWHIGSWGFSELSWNEMIDDVEEFGIEHIVAAGDLLQGKGVHRQEAIDLKVPDIDDQIDLAKNYLSELPRNVTVHATIGNHEEKLKGSIRVGLDILRRLSLEVDNFKYYGSVAKLKVDDNFDMLMMHSSGGLTYATSYRVERIYDKLVERTNLLVTGHMHRMMVLPKPPNNHAVISGTLQRENSYLLWKGATAQVGWIIVHELDYDRVKFEYRYPEVY